MSQDSREKFGVKSQMRGGGGGGGGGGKERKERKDMLKAGQSRGSIVCVNDGSFTTTVSTFLSPLEKSNICRLRMKFILIENDITLKSSQ